MLNIYNTQDIPPNNKELCSQNVNSNKAKKPCIKLLQSAGRLNSFSYKPVNISYICCFSFLVKYNEIRQIELLRCKIKLQVHNQKKMGRRNDFGQEIHTHTPLSPEELYVCWRRAFSFVWYTCWICKSRTTLCYFIKNPLIKKLETAK